MSNPKSFAPKTSTTKIPESERAWNFSGSGNMRNEFVLRDDLMKKEKQENVLHRSNHE